MSTETTDTEPITETITQSNIGDIVETLYNSDDDLIGYACKQVLEKNTVEPMDLIFYMDVLTPKAEEGSVFTADPQAAAVEASQEVLLREMSQEFQIDPDVSRGIRCFDLPVDGSTWIVKMTIDPKEFQEITLFGKCRKEESNSVTGIVEMQLFSEFFSWEDDLHGFLEYVVSKQSLSRRAFFYGTNDPFLV